MFILQVLQDTVIAVAKSFSNPIWKSIWFWLSIIQFVMIISIIRHYQKKIRDLANDAFGMDLQKAKTKDINMDDLMQSIAGARELYKKLSKVCHPDRFINDERHPIAEELFAEITMHQRNFKKLQELQVRAHEELKLTFND
jgi:hypothetical protein